MLTTVGACTKWIKLVLTTSLIPSVCPVILKNIHSKQNLTIFEQALLKSDPKQDVGRCQCIAKEKDTKNI
jgi:hypothetical protein